jgi:hypothetical protein
VLLRRLVSAPGFRDKIPGLGAARADCPGVPMKTLTAILVSVLALGALAPAAADTLLIQRVQAASKVVLPKRGMSMAAVEASFGVPPHKFAAVGGGSTRTPPITRWEYPEFSVYFENEHVVNSVLNKASELEIGPAPATR